MSLQRFECCRRAASNCCPDLVSSQYLVSSAHLSWSSVWAVVCCVMHGVSRKKKEKNKWVWDLEAVLCQATITSYVRVNQACCSRAFAISIEDHSSSNIVTFSVHAGDAWERA
eukprot:1143386-Pelagomonas_calceolata.AAC.3